MTPRYDDVRVGDALPPLTTHVQRVDLVMYAGASGDFNIIHWNERFATLVGLPNVIAHGMYTMAEAGRVVTDWVGDPGRVESFGVRFRRPVPVPDDDRGTAVTITGVVEEKLPAGRVAVALTATVTGDDGPQEVLSGARAVVRLD